MDDLSKAQAGKSRESGTAASPGPGAEQGPNEFFCEPRPLEASPGSFETAPTKPAQGGKQPAKRGRPPNSAYAVCGNPECGELFRVMPSELQFCCRACRWIMEQTA
jgi:hypothetical protein